MWPAEWLVALVIRSRAACASAKAANTLVKTGTAGERVLLRAFSATPPAKSARGLAFACKYKDEAQQQSRSMLRVDTR